MKKYKRMNQNGKFGGVLSGLAYCLGVPTWIVRLIFIALVFIWDVQIFGSSIIIVYFLVYFLAPEYEEDPKNYEEVCN